MDFIGLATAFLLQSIARVLAYNLFFRSFAGLHFHPSLDFQNVNPSRQWRVGQQLPRQFNSSKFELSDRQAKNLPKAARNQQWYKINGDYVLVNERTDRIVRIIG